MATASPVCTAPTVNDEDLSDTDYNNEVGVDQFPLFFCLALVRMRVLSIVVSYVATMPLSLSLRRLASCRDPVAYR